ncbi:MAG: hypothetical protein R6W91_06610, partial [Thermoplasmata archaeon]
ELNCTDSGVGGCVIHYSINGGTNWYVYSSPVIMLESTDLVYYAEDALGNAAQQKTVHITVTEPSTKPWTFYLGIALIIGAVCLLVLTFIPFKKKPRSEGDSAPRNERKAEKEEVADARTKRKKRNY